MGYFSNKKINDHAYCTIHTNETNSQMFNKMPNDENAIAKTGQ